MTTFENTTTTTGTTKNTEETLVRDQPRHHIMKHSHSLNAVVDIDQADVDDQNDTIIIKKDTLTSPAKNTQPPSPFATADSLNFASSSQGARIVFATDEWFATADRLLRDDAPQFDPDAYCQQGKVMDGWESRRRREAGHDWCILKLSEPGMITAIEIDTAHFTGNQVPAISLEIADLSESQELDFTKSLPGGVERLLRGGHGIQGTGMRPEQVLQAQCAYENVGEWRTLLPKKKLGPGYEETRMHYFTLGSSLIGTHIRVNYYPDGGVSRLRLWGNAVERPSQSPPALYLPITTGPVCTVVCHGNDSQLPSRRQPYEYPELSCKDQGGKGVFSTNNHFGVSSNLIQAQLGRDMGDGWETARHPKRPSVLVKDKATGLIDSPLQDWCVLQLGSPTKCIRRIILDTKHFRGNYPESVQVEGCYVEIGSNSNVQWENNDSIEWFPLIARCRMSPDAEHVFDSGKNQILSADRNVSHVRIRIFPDGGVSRVRVYGEPLIINAPMISLL